MIYEPPLPKELMGTGNLFKFLSGQEDPIVPKEYFLYSAICVGSELNDKLEFFIISDSQESISAKLPEIIGHNYEIRLVMIGSSSSPCIKENDKSLCGMKFILNADIPNTLNT